MLLDPSVTSSYIEDCEVCCNPIRVQANFDSGDLIQFDAQSIDQ